MTENVGDRFERDSSAVCFGRPSVTQGVRSGGRNAGLHERSTDQAMHVVRFERVTQWRTVADEHCSGATLWSSVFQIVRKRSCGLRRQGQNPFTLLFRLCKTHRHPLPVEVIYAQRRYLRCPEAKLG